ncbi:hypothetical protein PSPO01_12825 [Paraphaeosphaeria sporulosa]
MITMGPFAFLSVLLSLPWNIGGVATCGTADIVGNSVANCDCPTRTSLTPSCGGKGMKCNDPYCHVDTTGELVECFEGCVQGNIECDACYLYFHSLCLCMKKSNLNCIQSGDWWLLNDHKLITTSKKVPGILQLGSDNGGWEFGQSLLGAGTVASRQWGTLSVNSVLSRDEEQIHIHVCDNPSSALRTHLSTLNWYDFKDKPKPLLVPIAGNSRFPAGTVQCQAALNPGTHMDVAEITSKYVNSLGGCEREKVGAGLITDKNDYSWVCLTTMDDHAAVQLFCYV